MSNESPSRKLLPRSVACEIALATALAAGGGALVWHAVVEAHRGRPNSDVVETAGIAVILFGACFDPINAVALYLPWVFDDVAERTPFWRVRWWLFSIGFLTMILGWILRHSGT
jgi:hypothetical protein